MKIEYKTECEIEHDEVMYGDLRYGDIFMLQLYPIGPVYIKIPGITHQYNKTIVNFNAVNISTGVVTGFELDETVLPVNGKLIISSKTEI